MKIRVVFEGTPRCASSTAEYEEWRHFARFELLPSDFCTDCTLDYKCKMMQEGRCDYPEIQFDENNNGYLPEDYNDEPQKRIRPAKSLTKKSPATKRPHAGRDNGTASKKTGVTRHFKEP
jgi:hypothetical protein